MTGCGEGESEGGAHDAEDGSEADISEMIDVVLARSARPTGVSPPVAALNPEAGDHVVTTDPDELRAALKAGERTWRRFSYYERRYGERGRRFTHSDSAWIVTLAGMDPETVERQLRWLGRLLAARGMPRWLLEEHLATLHAELAVAAPHNRTAYDRLLQVAHVFREERLSHLDEKTSVQLAREFDRRVGTAAAGELPEAGDLLVAAVAEERVGLGRGVGSLLEWLADPTRFSGTWVTAANRTVQAARKRASG